MPYQPLLAQLGQVVEPCCGPHTYPEAEPDVCSWTSPVRLGSVMHSACMRRRDNPANRSINQAVRERMAQVRRQMVTETAAGGSRGNSARAEKALRYGSRCRGCAEYSNVRRAHTSAILRAEMAWNTELSSV